ncbi:MAG TPA: hypothetical protein DIC42_05755 [Holosporales bacterium]|nr:hypothetical protein [Holosporales bacterium]
MKKILLTTLLMSTAAFASNKGFAAFKAGFLKGASAEPSAQAVPTPMPVASVASPAPAPATEIAGNWTEVFQTRVGPVTHTPTFVKLGFMQAGTGVQFDCASFNDVPLTAPLNLLTNSTRAAFVAAMQASGIL